MPQIADNIKKVAVTFDVQQAQLIELDQGRPLAAIIKDVCNGWNLSDPDDYAIQFSENTKQFYITERNRVEIKNGNVLKLSPSPTKAAQDITDKLKGGTLEKQVDSLKNLAQLSGDITFAQEFMNKNGLQIIIQIVEAGTYTGEILGYLLKSCVELMDHNIVSWDILKPEFIKIVCSCTNLKPGTSDRIALESALEILENIVLYGCGSFSIIQQDVTPVNLIPHLQSNHPDVQKNTIALINALFIKSDDGTRKQNAEQLMSKNFRNVILNSVVRARPMGTEMAHQLYVLQCLLLGLLNEVRRTPVSMNDPSADKDLAVLRKTAFEAEIDPTASLHRRRSHMAEFKKLGFENFNDPLEDFRVVPPGVLALQTMTYFARNHADDYSKVVLENSCRADDHDLPFAKALIDLTNILCEILNVGEPPLEEVTLFHPMFFTCDKPFMELFCAVTLLLNKTWREMRATSADLPKVLSVVREQTNRALETQPGTFEQLKIKLNALTYAEITNLWLQERRHKEEWESQAKPIMELREQIKPEVIDLIKQQRLNYLVEGTLFKNHTGNRRKYKHWYCRLSPNHKLFHYGDCEENDKPSMDQLSNKLNIVDITKFVTGKDCPHVSKDAKIKKHTGTYLTFSIIIESEMGENLNFIAQSDHDFDMWTDGINALLNNKLTSKLAEQDMEKLLGMEIKLRLLDTEGISIPETPPEMPSEPPNYDFAYDV